MTTVTARRIAARLTVSAAALGAVALVGASAAFADSPHASASAQVVDVNIPGAYTYTASAPATSASNDGGGSADPVSGTPHALPSGTIFDESSNPQHERVEAGTDGSSWACAANGGLGINVSGGGQTCQSTAQFGSTIIRLDSMPIIGAALASTPCPEMRLSWTVVLSHAYAAAPDGPTGGTTISSLHVTPCSLASQPADCRSLTITPDLSPNVDFLAEIIATMAAHTGCDPMTAALQGIAANITFRTNEQTTLPDGSFQVTGMDFVATGATPSSFRFSRVSVGPNSVPVVDTPMVSAEQLSVLGGAVLLAAAGVAVIRRRRNGATNLS